MSVAERVWDEGASAVYRQMAAVAVPARAEQTAAIVALMPFARNDAFRVVDVGAGEGALSATVLDSYPHSEVCALDGSESMRARTAARLARFERRAVVEPFRLEDLDGEWLDAIDGAGAVVSSLCIHHLDGADKQRLFRQVWRRLDPGGALLTADVVEPVRQEAADFYAATWDRATEEQALAIDGSRDRYREFIRQRWNLYRYPDPEVDKPSPVADQLRWLEDAGFEAVDCFWMRAGHAVLGGYKPGPARSGKAVGFEDALACARAELGEEATE